MIAVQQSTERKEIGIIYDTALDIICDDVHAGNAYINTYFDVEDSFMDQHYFLEWIEFDPVFRNKGLLRYACNAICDYFGERSIRFDLSPENIAKYMHIGAKITGYDDFRDMYEAVYCL